MLFSLFEKTNVQWSCDAGLKQWRKQVLDTTNETLAMPPWLRRYQEEGVAWLAQRLHCGCHPLLADEMGLGKTMQVLSLLAVRPVANKPVLIVCPASVVPVWEQEAARFFPELKVHCVRAGDHFANASEPVVWLCSYTQLRRHKAFLTDVDFGYAVLDEAQFIKNPDTKVAQACLNIRADHRLALSGTPLENKHLDLWMVFRFLMPGLLGQRKHFEMRIESEGNAFVSLLRRQIAPFVLRRTKAAVLTELPEKLEVLLPCLPTDLQQAEYVRLVTEAKVALNNRIAGSGADTVLNLFTWLLRLRQVACHPALLPGMATTHWSQSGKIVALIDRLEAIFDSGKKVVIFSQFVAFLEHVARALDECYPKVPRYQLTGETKNRSEPVAGFQRTQGGGVILVSLRAGGTGITLHAADYVFLLDPWWNPAVEAQAVDRVHRMGQKSSVMVYRMITPGTLEERIQLLKEKKSALFDAVVGDLPPVSALDHYFSSLGALIDYTG
jgi:SNF2 family DNA or RNA helicase